MIPADASAEEKAAIVLNVAMEHASKLAAELGVPVEKISFSKMKGRPKEFHSTRFAYYDKPAG